MKPLMFRDLITLGPVEHDTQGLDHPSGTRAGIVRASRLAEPGRRKWSEAVIDRDDESFLRHEYREVFNVSLTRNQALYFFAPGQRFILRNGHDTGAGVVSRRVFASSSPS